MEPELGTNITYFKTYEEREEAFRASVFLLIPRKYSGPRLFWKDFGRITHGPLPGDATGPVAYITGNPRDCLVYGTPGQALAAAQMCVRGTAASDGGGVVSVASRFALEDNLDQPVRTLSGGETVKVALAKAFIAAGYCHRLTVASPFTWLSQSNRIYLLDLVQRYRRAGLPVKLLALDGEDSNEPLPAKALPIDLRRAEIEFELYFRALKIPLATSINPLYQADRHAGVEDFSANLKSPCLLLGDNGQGKSLIAKALAGAVTSEGECGIAGPVANGPVRILLQDVVGQTLLRNFDAIRASAGHGQGQQFRQIYQEIMVSAGAINGLARHSADLDRPLFFRSLLEMKAALLAVRLCGRPAALILDEPDWGLSRPVAIDFVFNAIRAAHKRGTPVVLISHKPWWLNAAGSILQVQRLSGGFHGTDPQAFKIRLKPAN